MYIHRDCQDTLVIHEIEGAVQREMRHFKIGSLCLVVAFVLAALGAATASASLPAVYQCVKAQKVGKKYVGHYTNKTCSTLASSKEIEEGKTNKYELEEWNEAGKGGASKVKAFKGKSGTAFLEIRKVGPITCKKGSDTGKFTGPKTVGEVNVTFTGCELDKASCSNTGKAGEIKTKTLKGEIGYVSEVFGKPVEQTTVGIDLTPQSGEYEAEEILCALARLRVTGSVIGEVLPPYNVFTKVVKLRFQQSAGKQAIQSLEGMPKDTLLAETWDGSEWNPGEGFAASGEIVMKGEELELKA